MDDEFFKLCDILCTNESETELLIGKKLHTLEDYKLAASTFLNYGPKFAIVTLGENGALIAEKDGNDVKIEKVEAMEVKAIDTTGAGDCFCGAFAYYLNQNFNVKECVEKAAQVASLSVTKSGNQSSYPTKDELMKRGLI